MSMFPIRDHESSGVFPVITISIIAITLIVLIIEFFVPDLDALFVEWALVPSKLDFGNVLTLYPLISSMFLHAGFMHFFSNMWFLWIFGDNVEAALGKVGYALFYLSGGIIAGLAQYLFLRGETIPVLGASGAIAAVLGFYFIRYPHYTVDTLIFFGYSISTTELPAQLVLIFWFILQFLNGTVSFATKTAASSGVAWWAHIGGFVFGMVVAVLIAQVQKLPVYLKKS